MQNNQKENENENKKEDALITRPSLQQYQSPKRLSDYPDATCFQAGHLVTKNAGWRNKRPVIDQSKCVSCMQCYMYCPDGVIFQQDGKLKIDYDFCKGCGICAKMCRIHAIEMKEEHQ